MINDHATHIRDAWAEFVDAVRELRRGTDDGFWVPTARALYWRWARIAKGGAD